MIKVLLSVLGVVLTVGALVHLAFFSPLRSKPPEPTYTVRVVHAHEDLVRCVNDNAQPVLLMQEGEWIPACLTPVQH